MASPATPAPATPAPATPAGAVELDISRLVARIAELEERLYAAELRADDPGPPRTPSSATADWKAALRESLASGRGEGGGRTAQVVVSTVKSFWRKATGEVRAGSEFDVDGSMSSEFGEEEREAIIKSKNTAAAYLAEAAEKLQAAESEKINLNAKLQELQEAAEAEVRSARQLADSVRAEAEAAVEARNAALAAEGESLKAQGDALRQWGGALEEALGASQGATAAAQAHGAEMERRWLAERLKRRAIHEELQVLRGNIRVVARVRPLQAGEAEAVEFPADGAISVRAPEGKRAQDFEFDAAFPPGATQADVFGQVEGLVRSCADGYNACIFAYGQTGSGKTHTMEGPAEDPGISVRALQTLFEMIAEDEKHAGPGASRTIQVSMLEIYNDAVRDLLRNKGDVAAALDVSGMGPGQLPPDAERVPGLTWRPVSCMQEVLTALKDGSQNRKTCATKMNSSSSRSHALLSIRMSAPQGATTPCSHLHLVDLAGSERVNKSGVSGDALKEAQAINKSLSALGDVISSLQRKAAHIPFRNSKLTQVLQDSLCGSSKVMLVCNVSPEADSVSETLSSLQFASRASQVEMGQAKKVGDSTPTARKASGRDSRTPASGTRPGSARAT